MASNLVRKIELSKAFLMNAQKALNDARPLADGPKTVAVIETYVAAYVKISETLDVFIRALGEIEAMKHKDADGDSLADLEEVAMGGTPE